MPEAGTKRNPNIIDCHGFHPEPRTPFRIFGKILYKSSIRLLNVFLQYCERTQFRLEPTFRGSDMEPGTPGSHFLGSDLEHGFLGSAHADPWLHITEISLLPFQSFCQKCREFGDCADYVTEPVLAKLTNSTTGTNLYNVNLFGCKDELFMSIVTLECLKKTSGNQVLRSFKLKFFEISGRRLILFWFRIRKGALSSTGPYQPTFLTLGWPSFIVRLIIMK